MREILFRGKAIKDINPDFTVNTQWVYGYYAKIKPCTGIYGKKEEYIEEEIPKIISGQEAITVNPNTIGQYTGLKDKNGKKIFEGDMVKCYDKNVDESFFAIIMFGNPNGFYNYGWQLKPIGKTDFNVDILCWVDMEDAGAYIEIIGNIYENPELLEDKK